MEKQMKLSKKLFKLACKILLADVNYFKLPENLLDDIYKRFCDLNKQLNEKSPHITVVINKQQMSQYFENYQHYNNEDVKPLQILFLNSLNETQETIGDYINLTDKMKQQILNIRQNNNIKGVTIENGENIIINNNKHFKIKSILQHQLIHAIRMRFKLMPQKYIQQIKWLNSLKRYFLTDRQFPSLVSDCCYQFENLKQFNFILKYINKIENLELITIYEKLNNVKYNQNILFLIVLKKYKKHKYQKAVSFIQEYLKNEH